MRNDSLSISGAPAKLACAHHQPNIYQEDKFTCLGLSSVAKDVTVVVPLQALHEDQQKQIEELTAQLQEAQINKSRLETRCQLLEKVVSIRGEGGDMAGSSVSAS